ncbi:deoxyribodipyrimidine photolyase-related protein [Marinospirillum celere]|uniref:Deoxyribodipyrimidine photolyase-related protein n=1 Tax=Marinospirillum celere TaxID=1122252 RepID=A0A1I1E2I9_9GAMM|nr:cryptochrome/photolyase family protein [Marinospirillum celere]SFB79438.1 deoxyribodipyrimidine photolyase-related protein [Marinospirillum celere]
MAKNLRLLLGDQLNLNHSWFQQQNQDVVYLIAELHQEAGYVVHHIQKLVGFFLAMQEFVRELQEAGHQVDYLTLDATQAYQDLPALIQAKMAEHQASVFEYQLPDEYRLDQQLKQLAQQLNAAVQAVDSEHFLTSRNAWQEYPNHRMEYFYRQLRKKYQVLMDADHQPLGGQWNYDQDNRQALPKDLQPPEPLLFAHNVEPIVERIQRHALKTLGSIDAETFIWPVTRSESLILLDDFLQRLLPNFGRYQDALTGRCWSLYHSRISFALNTKMLHPLEVIRSAEEHWQANSQQITLAQVEGFIRQILGWREFVRALYWEKMPDYGQLNHLQANRDLPSFFWDGQTQMACMRQAIDQSLEFAYAHHIQRLMVTGNFALLAGLDPEQVDAWYLGIYIDAIEWVELPNTRGMSQYADGGLMASKPYAASGNYINKMGDHCKACHYKVNEKTGPKSCPFNSLYWHFLQRHQAELQTNPRMKFPYASWRKMSSEQQSLILETAEAYLSKINQL